MDIVFDFTSSPVGGGLRRIDAYAEYFESSPLKTLFLVHPTVAERLNHYGGIRIESVTRSDFAKLTGDANYLRLVGSRQRPHWLFSYGIPIHARVAEKCWFHVSNVLPLYLDGVTLDLKLRAKMTVLSWWIRHRASDCDVVSAESKFSIERYNLVTKTSGRRVLLHNGIPTPQNSDHGVVASGDYAVAVGTAGYKRIDRTYEAFLGLKEELGVTQLKIIGDPTGVPSVIRDSSDVEVLRFLTEVDYVDLLSRARVFISTSETENSSCAVLEGLFLSERALLSNIPSHFELLKADCIEPRRLGSQRLVLADRNSVDVQKIPTWRDVIEMMLMEMKLI